MRFMKTFSHTSAALLALALILSMPAAAENLYEKEVKKEKAAVKLVREVQQGDYDVVTTEELKSWIHAGKDMVLIDAMPEGHYEEKHLPGARQFLFPVPEMLIWNPEETGGRSLQDYMDLLGPDKEKPVVVYCGFVKCTRSHNAALWARHLGYKNVYRHPGGIYAWQGKGLETEAVD